MEAGGVIIRTIDDQTDCTYKEQETSCESVPNQNCNTECIHWHDCKSVKVKLINSEETQTQNNVEM